MPKEIFINNMDLIRDKRFSYLTQDVSSAATTIRIQSIIGFESLSTSSGQVLCIGEIGRERSDVRYYIEKTLEDAGLDDQYLSQGLKKIIDAGTSEQTLKYVKPMVALQAIRTSFELRDRFPAAKIEAKSVNLDVQLKGASIDDLRGMLESLHSKSQQFLKLVKTK